MKIKYLLVALCFFCSFLEVSYADSYKGTTTTGVRLRSEPSTSSSIIVTLSKNSQYKLVSNTLSSGTGCSDGWYKIYYTSTKTGYVCATYLNVTTLNEGDPTDTDDPYNRPWTSPKSAIVGGAKFITSTYISKGQYTSYLKKFNVNPDSKYKVYNHQYMANLQAPYSEAYSSFKSYRDNNLLSLALEFIIPVYDEMPDYTSLPGGSANTTCESNILDNDFEALLNQENFPESYKCKLREIHKTYPNWKFKAMHTALNFNNAIRAEQAVSSISGKDIYYYRDENGNTVSTENGWYMANNETVAYYLDPRNFLIPERILMFENLGYSDNYTESVVSSILSGTFMDGYSLLDNQTYASIFVEAGRTASISSVYLASLAKQESGTKGSKATSGDEFTYNGVTYKGLYNFFNIGAYSSESSPVLAGLVWASGGVSSVIVNTSDSNSSSSSTNETSSTVSEDTILSKLGVSKTNDYIYGLSVGTTLGSIANSLGYNVSIDGSSNDTKIKTNQKITITVDSTSFTYSLVVKGDTNEDGDINPQDYVKIKNYIMEKSGSQLNAGQSLAADYDGNGEINPQDYVQIKKSIMEG